ncbi:MAG: tRNA pseudouridine55 synthase [Actinomycetota bacterium]|jgi:tRNA pseudouridine55 synthase|nr:tRNA pseudouridine55 synthase [Actinomycetota bacterium]
MGSAGGPTDGLLVVDKPAGWTSHDVVARTRRLAGTRRVGHAGTLDPMATGVLVLGLGKATRLLGHLTLTEKAYDATIRLGASTLTDDAEGEVTATTSAGEVTEQAIREGVAALTGAIEQVPSSVSAIKVDGERAYRRVRAGDEVTLAARPVVVSQFEVLAVRRTGDSVDVDVSLVCSSGTYVRALARDLGAALGVGGHLRALRRTRVGPYDLDASRTLEQLEVELDVLPMAAAVRAAFPVREVDAAAAVVISHGGPLPALGMGPGPVAVLGPDGAFLALVEERDGRAKPTAVFV